jgi:glycosyltransferase involved in cell wall biosynthesis
MATTTRPKLSVIIPVYNTEKYLPACIDSLLRQTLPEVEIILVDDGSPDNCPAICDAYAAKFHNVKVIHKENAGQGFARNAGIAVASGEYIAFVDSDDDVDTHTYRKLYDIATDTKSDAVYFTYRRFNDRGETWGGDTTRKEARYQTESDIRSLMLDMIANPPDANSDHDVECSSCCAIYCSELIRKHGLAFRSERIFHSEDLLFNLDFLSHAASVVFIPDALYHYRDNPASFCHAIRADIIERELFYDRHLQEWLAAHQFGREGFLRATRQFISDTRGSIRQYVQSALPAKEKKQWLKGIVHLSCWKEIAALYPYGQLPPKHRLFFYLLYRRSHRLLYHLSKIGRVRY